MREIDTLLFLSIYSLRLCTPRFLGPHDTLPCVLIQFGQKTTFKPIQDTFKTCLGHVQALLSTWAEPFMLIIIVILWFIQAVWNQGLVKTLLAILFLWQHTVQGNREKFFRRVLVPGSRSQVWRSGDTALSWWEGLVVIIINFCLKFILTQLKLYGTLHSLQHVLMARCFPDSKLLWTFTIDFYFISNTVGIWKVKKNRA